MKHISLLLSCMLLAFCSIQAENQWKVTSPDGQVTFVLQNQTVRQGTSLAYSVLLNGKEAVQRSRMGLEMDNVCYGDNCEVRQLSTRHVQDAYTLKSGKRLQTVDDCTETVFEAKGKNNECPLQITVRVYNDGAAFRYGFNGTSAEKHVINQEMTEFAIPVEGKAWIHPYDWNSRHKPSYEQYCMNGIAIRSKSKYTQGWGFPMLFETSGMWIFVTEAYLDGTYPATHVDNTGAEGAYRIRFPEAEEPVIPDDPHPASTLPWQTPWRVIAVGTELNTIFQTQIVAHLNPPSRLQDTAWIKPGRSLWSWWYKGSTATDYDAQISYVDYCAKMGWEYSLIDSGWPRMKAPGMKGVVDYAKKKGVGIWLWYHSGAGAEPIPEDPYRTVMAHRDTRRAEMERISKIGVKGIKVDFFDTDKQAVVALYAQILQDAAEYHLLVDFHGATLPRGFERTYPNLLATEAIRGAESLGQQPRCDVAAEHNAIVPFTRNIVGSMDYTPVTFSNKIRQGVPAIRRTSMAHQLALAVVFESGFQCFADKAEAYLELPKVPKTFMQQIPTTWDESILLAGYPGDYVVVARRSGNAWYIGGINGKKENREISFTLPKSLSGKRFTLIKDGADINTFAYEQIKVTDGAMTVKLLGEGGFAAMIK